MIRRLLIFALVLVNISCDQAMKSVVRDKISEHERINVVQDYFVLMNVENTGAMLGLGSELGMVPKTIFLLVFPTIILLSILVAMMFRPKANRYVVLGLTCVIGGGLGNLFDRMVYGSVTDFLHIDLVVFKTGIFNMADVSIMCGLVLIILSRFLGSKEFLPA